MTDAPLRQPFWTDRTWAELQRIIKADDSWRKPAHAPQLFGLTARGVALATYLLDRGCLPAVVGGEDGAMTMTVPLPGRSVQAVVSERPELREEVGRYRDRPHTWHALATLDLTGHDRSVTVLNGSIVVTVSLPFRRSHGSETLAELSELVTAYRAVLDDQVGGPPGAGYADLISTLIEAGLAVPLLPSSVRDELARVDTWCWSTRPDDATLRMSDYLMETAPLLEGAVSDHVTVSHGGHGISSYALTWRMAYGPLAFVVQEAWGNWGGGPRDNGHLAETFAHVAALLDRVEKKRVVGSSAPTGEWVRPVLVEYSGLRGILRCSIWDPIRGERISLNLEDADPWEQISEWVDASSVPSMRPEQQAKWAHLRSRRS